LHEPTEKESENNDPAALRGCAGEMCKINLRLFGTRHRVFAANSSRRLPNQTYEPTLSAARHHNKSNWHRPGCKLGRSCDDYQLELPNFYDPVPVVTKITLLGPRSLFLPPKPSSLWLDDRQVDSLRNHPESSSSHLLYQTRYHRVSWAVKDNLGRLFL
jgi:hypothetical protein